MNTKLLPVLILIAGFSSCTTLYKSGQTPDDVYYSPAIPQNDYVRVESEEDRNTYSSSEEDREIRRRINNRRLRVYNDYDYNYPYAHNYPYTYNPYIYNYPYNYSWYSPIFVNPVPGKSPSVYTGPRKFNLGTYNNNTPNNNVIYQPNLKTKVQRSGTVPVRSFTNSTTNNGANRSSGVGNFIRRVLTSPSGNNTNTMDNSSQNRTYQPVRSAPATTITNNSSSNSSNVPVRTFRK